MADIVLRLEKTLDEKAFDGKTSRVLYVQFEREARNVIKRLWNKYSDRGICISLNERENFHDAASVENYLKNARKQYEGQGFKVIEPAAPVTPVTEDETIELT